MREPTTQPQLSPAKRLKRLYIIALGVIALLAITGQVLVQQAIQDQSEASRLINIAGRQRMLSQQLSKAALAIRSSTDESERLAKIEELRAVTAQWEAAHLGLQRGDDDLGLPGDNSSEVVAGFAAIEQNYQAMLTAAQTLMTAAERGQNANYPAIRSSVS
ncbi:MAG: type IV pili methyl-accepting chemotaxis transducer N-terminal domain-containing protein, partial [Anaerolineae bacterium]|nr:type IV pili methyl-accepting chemotaxis transducer N-terminal domain-containing protein [Anaerolineae bacterium]